MRAFGWLPDAPDHRDRVFLVAEGAQLPDEVDIRDEPRPPVLAQGSLASCTANVVGGMLHWARLRMVTGNGTNPSTVPSRLFIYWNARVLAGTTDRDSGCTFRQALAGVAHHGACLESGISSWPYDPSRVLTPPSARRYLRGMAKRHRVMYMRVPSTLRHIQACLASGHPVGLGHTVYGGPDLPTGPDYTLPLPTPGQPPTGGHAWLAVGYSNARGALLVRNSYGLDWGYCGHAWLPYPYVADPRLAGAAWTLRLVCG